MVKVQKIPACACAELHAQYMRREYINRKGAYMGIFGGFETSSDLKDPIQIGGLVSPGGKYDCWSHNFVTIK